MSLLALPPELIFHVASFVQTERALSNLSRCSHYLHDQIGPVLFQRNANRGGNSALVWGTRKNVPSVVRKAMVHVTDPALCERLNLVADATLRGHHGMLELLFTEYKVKPRSTGRAHPPVYTAVQNDSQRVLEVLIRHGASLTASPYDDSPLHLAARRGKVAMAKMLLDAGADVNARGRGGSAPLHFAADNDSKEMVELLLERGAEINAVVEWRGEVRLGMTPLGLALKFRQMGVAEFLVQKGADIHATHIDRHPPLHWAAESRRLDVARFALANGIGASDGDAEVDSDTPLHVAAQHGDMEMVKLLLEAGADINAKGEMGNTALAYAADAGRTAVAAYLLQQGADVDAVDAEGHTATTAALGNMNMELLKSLVAAGADLDKKCVHGDSALLNAVGFKYLDGVKVLLDHGADIYAKDPWGRQPHSAAAVAGDARVLQYLLCRELLDINHTDDDGRTALFHAAIAGHERCVDVLLANQPKASIHIKDRYGATPLIAAARNGHKKVVLLLTLQLDVPLFEVDLFGYNAGHWAAKSGSKDTMKILEQNFGQQTESVGVDRIPEATYDDAQPACDVCGRSTVHERYGQAMMCNTCLPDDYVFVICAACRLHGATCRDADHDLEEFVQIEGDEEDEDGSNYSEESSGTGGSGDGED